MPSGTRSKANPEVPQDLDMFPDGRHGKMVPAMAPLELSAKGFMTSNPE